MLFISLPSMNCSYNYYLHESSIAPKACRKASLEFNTRCLWNWTLLQNILHKIVFWVFFAFTQFWVRIRRQTEWCNFFFFFLLKNHNMFVTNVYPWNINVWLPNYFRFGPWMPPLQVWELGDPFFLFLNLSKILYKLPI